MRALLLLLFLVGCMPGASIFIADPATATSLGNSATVLNTASATFTRATGAYDPNADAVVGSGVRRQRNQAIGSNTYAMDLIEGARTNLLTAGTSERFDQWTAANGLTVTADSTAAPNGEVIAQTLTDPGASLSSARQTFTVANDSLLHAFSIYVKKTAGGTAPTFGVTLALSVGTGVTTNARINTDTGAQQYGSNANTSVVSADSTYWRVIVIVANNTTGNTTLTLDVYPAAAAYGASVDDAAATGTAIVTFADLNKSAASSTSTFAASYNSNRNVLLQSEVMGTTWAVTRSTVTSNTTANPIDSAVTADTLNDDNTAANTHFISQSFTKAASAIQFTYSTYIKQSGCTWAFVQCSDTALTNGAGIYFNVATGAKGTAVALGAGWTLDASTITAVGSWYRCTITVTTATSTTIKSEVYSATGDLLAIHNGINAAALILWGNQLVYGSVPKTYWATTTLGLRAADLLTNTVSDSVTAGTLIVVARPYGWTGDQDGTVTFNPAAWRGNSINGVVLPRSAATTSSANRRSDAGTANFGPSLTPGYATGVNTTLGITWNQTAVASYLNGPSAGTPVAAANLPFNPDDTFYPGGTNAATGQFYGYGLGLYWASVLPPSSMQIFANGVAP